MATTAYARFAFAGYAQACAIIDTSRNLDFQFLAYLHCAFAVTFLAFFMDNLASPATMGTGPDVDHLAKRRILYDPLLACAVADRTGIYLAARFGTVAVAMFTRFILRHLDFHFRPEGSLFECNVHIEAEISSPFRTIRLSAALAAKEGIKDITKSTETARAESALTESAESAKASLAEAAGSACAILERIGAELVVLGTLVLIGQDAVGFVDFLELFFCSLRVVPVFIWMIFYCQFAKRFFDVRFAGVPGNAKYFIIIFFAHMGSPSLLTTYFWSSSTTL